MVNKEESMDNITLFSIITMMSFVLLFPVACYLEGVKFSPAYFKLAAEQGMNVKQVLSRSLLAALCFHAYQQVSYMILQRVSPVTHSVGNCVKRVVAGGSDCQLCHLLQDSRLPHQFSRYWHCSCWSIPILKSQAY
ncbi:hypothetical protein SAY87_026346 [Trapa incisa]|uniref:Sugar phosphate transporter domain-containing protein n=1 Tax=Trapa incisa TaxID=236973 RepID=A0AAN7JJW6_9MYRT|nr:hypothetical protein SAY87_026346 [Trapa incisa]